MKRGRNIILIGMPGAGKSTVGVVLAKRMGLGFVDTDLLIQLRTGRRLQQIIDEDGLAAFRALEESTIVEFDVCDAVIATGGSVIYSDKAMTHLAALGTIVYLDVPLPELEKRLHDMESRGLVIDPGSTLADLYAERTPLYRRWAKIRINATGKNLEEVVDTICQRLAI